MEKQVQILLAAVKLLQNIPEKIDDNSDMEIVIEDFEKIISELKKEVDEFYDFL